MADMTANAKGEVETFMQGLIARNPGEPEFHQAAREVIETIMPVVLEREVYRKANLLERLTEPDRVVSFRVVWQDDKGHVNVNKAWRVQFNNAIGPYKGGMRFHPTVNQGVLKFLGFEQIFKNALTGLPMGGGKGGSNFDPKGKSDSEVLRFCNGLMSELYRHIGSDTDVPAGDIGVGAREVGYMFGQYKRLANVFTGVLTGKGLAYGGSLIRPEATGYGAVYFVENMLATKGDSVRGKTALVSGSGNVSIYCLEKLVQLGAKALTASDSEGTIYDPAGIDAEKVAFIKDLKEVRRGRIKEYAQKFKGVEFHEGKRPWAIKADLAFPCATQNEIEAGDAEALIKSGCKAVSEGANMPSTLEATHKFLAAKVLYGPAKAANAGGVAVSGLEQSQNASRLSWTREEVDTKLQDIMKRIHDQCVRYGKQADGSINYVQGANVAGFIKVADAMLAQGY